MKLSQILIEAGLTPYNLDPTCRFIAQDGDDGFCAEHTNMPERAILSVCWDSFNRCKTLPLLSWSEVAEDWRYPLFRDQFIADYKYVEQMRNHLLSRGLNPANYSGVYVDHDSATFLLWNLSGQLVGYQVYRPDKEKSRSGEPRDRRYFTFVSRFGGSSPTIAVWGLETLDARKPVYICEGIFDACRLHSLGLSAIAVLGNNPKPLQGWLSCLPQKKIAVCDGGSAGAKLSDFADESFFFPEGRDAGDSTDEEILNLIRRKS